MGVLCGVVARGPAFTHMFGGPPCICCLFCIFRRFVAVVGTSALTEGNGAVLIVTVKLMAVTVGRFARHAALLARRMQQITMEWTFPMV